MAHYAGATYQHEIMRGLKDAMSVKFWGPGFPGYEQGINALQIIKRVGFKPDIVVIGHSWLDNAIAGHAPSSIELCLGSVDVPVVTFLNKEYSELAAKLDYVREVGTDLLVSHHHDVSLYAGKVGAEPHFMPFATSESFFSDLSQDVTRIHDLFFSGILQNPTYPETQGDFRLRMQNAIFYTLKDIPHVKRKAFVNQAIFWRPLYGDWRDLIIRISKGARPSHQSYSQMLMRSKVCVNGLSPMGLIGTRFFESMASGALVLAEPSDLYTNIEDLQHHVIQVEPNPDVLENLFDWIIEEPNQVALRRVEAQEFVASKHTWKHRIDKLNPRLLSLIEGG